MRETEQVLTTTVCYRLSFQELKIAAVQDVMALRAKGVVSGNDKFQALLDSIASDIRLKRELAPIAFIASVS